MIFESKQLIGYHGCHFLIVRDEACGKSHRYTVYCIPSHPSNTVEIVGLELTLDHARRIATGERQ